VSQRLLVTLVLAWTAGTLLAAAVPAPVTPFPVHRIYIPDDALAQFLQSSRGKDVRILPLAEVRRLVADDLKARQAEAQRVADGTAPSRAPWVVLGATFTARQEGDQFRVQATYRLRVQTAGWHSVPLVRGDAAMTSARIDGHEARLVLEGTGTSRPSARPQYGLAQQRLDMPNMTQVALPPADGPGTFFVLLHQADDAEPRSCGVKLDFLVPIRTVEYYRQATFQVLPSPTTDLSLDLDDVELDVAVDGGLAAESTEKDGRTTARFQLRPRSSKTSPSARGAWMARARFR